MTNVLDVSDRNWNQEVLESKILTVVDFWHDKCSWCRKYNPIFEEAAKDYKNRVKFVKLNILERQENKDLAIKHGVMGTPTLIFFCDGRSVGEAVGFRDKESLNEILQDMLEKHKVCVSQSSKLDV